MISGARIAFLAQQTSNQFRISVDCSHFDSSTEAIEIMPNHNPGTILIPLCKLHR